MNFSENEFYTCPYCKSAKDKETRAKVDEKRRFLRVTYQCGTEIEIEWDGPDANSKWKVVCIPDHKIN